MIFAMVQTFNSTEFRLPFLAFDTPASAFYSQCIRRHAQLRPSPRPMTTVVAPASRGRRRPSVAAMPGNRQMQTNVLKLDPRDNVLVALTPLRKGEQISFSDKTYTLLSDI